MDDTATTKTSVFQQVKSQPTSNHEEQLGRMDEHIKDLQKEHPEWDLKASSRWWAPSIALSADLQENLDQVTNDRVNSCFARILDQNFAPHAVAEARAEMKSILTRYPDILRQIEASLFQREEALAEIHQYTTSNAAAGKLLGSCAAMPR